MFVFQDKINNTLTTAAEADNQLANNVTGVFADVRYFTDVILTFTTYNNRAFIISFSALISNKNTNKMLLYN